MFGLKANLDPVTSSWREALRFFSILRRFRSYLRPQIWPMIVAVLASIAFTVVTLLEPWPLKLIFDGVLLKKPVDLFGIDLTSVAHSYPMRLLAAAALAVLLLAVLRGQFYYLQNVRAAEAGQDVVMGIRRSLFHHLQILSLSFHHKARSGDLLMRLTGDIVMLREMVVAALITLMTQGLVVFGVLSIMASLNLRLTLVATFVVPLLYLVLTVFRIRLVEAAKRQRKREGKLATNMHEVLSSIQVVQANTAEKYEDERFKEMNKRSLRAGVRLTRIEAQLNRSVEISIAFGICGILWLGSQDVLSGRLSPGDLLVFLSYLRSLYRPLRQASKLTQRMAKASACGDRVLEVLDEVPEVEDSENPVALRGVKGRVSFRNVSFSYVRDKPVLKDINLEISPGEMVAVMGPTGAGKTTLLSLIPRFHDPQSGEVLVEDIPVKEIRLKSLRRQISFLPQEGTVMGISIRENIAYGAIGRKGPPPDDEEIQEMAKTARAHEFIRKLPKKYDTIIGERGSTLSGGQRQRIAIARALLRNAPILLLDEPMTGLDPISEKAVLEALEVLTRTRTTLVIAHRLSTVLTADRIVFLDKGGIVEDGTHEDLLRVSGRYAEFFNSEWGTLSSHA